MTDKESMIRKLNDSVEGITIEEDVPMSEHTSFRAGGNADIFVKVESEEDLCRVLKILSGEEYPHMILGNGTNILVRDGGYRGAIVKPGKGFQTIKRDGDCLICGASALLSSVSRYAMQEALGGFEFASGIPGSIGGAVFMNAGAYDGEMKQVVQSVRLVSSDGSSSCVKTADQLELGYRKSAIQKTGEIVTEVRIKLHKGNVEEIRSTITDLMERRNAKQPVSLPSAGSFFKRPQGYFAAKLIQDAGLKGTTVGGAQVSPLHSGFIVNIGGATATDILQLMTIVQARVMEQFGVDMEPEVRIIGEE